MITTQTYSGLYQTSKLEIFLRKLSFFISTRPTPEIYVEFWYLYIFIYLYTQGIYIHFVKSGKYCVVWNFREINFSVGKYSQIFKLLVAYTNVKIQKLSLHNVLRKRDFRKFYEIHFCGEWVFKNDNICYKCLSLFYCFLLASHKKENKSHLIFQLNQNERKKVNYLTFQNLEEN